MENQSVRVFNAETLIRLGLQNRVMRKLRAMGCKVVKTHLDSMLTIDIEPPKTPSLRRQPGGFSERRTVVGHIVSIDMDGCRVMWVEGRA